jgi:carbonic anhydrase
MAARTRATGLTAEEALARLVEGNGRFRRGKARRAAVRRKSLADLAKGQRPYATRSGDEEAELMSEEFHGCRTPPSPGNL